MNNPGLWGCFCHTLRSCLTNMACAPFFLIAVLFYAFYYCWPYMAQLPQHIDAVIVDEDNSPLSLRLCRDLEATPYYNIVQVFRNRPAAILALRQAKATSIIGIPPGFEKDAINGIPTALTLITSGAFIVKAHSAITGASGPLEQVASLAIEAELLERGLPLRQSGSGTAPSLLIVPMYNTVSGYLSFAVAIVFVIIFQTIMICGFTMLLNAWFSMPEYPAPLVAALRHPIYLLTLQAPVFCICIFWIFFVEGWAFFWQGINSFQNIPSTILVSIFFAWAVTSLGLLAGLLMKKSRFAIHIFVTSSLPCVFISGNLFPWQDIPIYMRAFAWLLPSTPGVDAMLRASQAGASPELVFPYLMHLLFLGLIYFGLAWLVAGKSPLSPQKS